jgi:hypothetical protein
MRDPHNPYRPYTYRSADRDAEYTRDQQRRRQANWDFINQLPGISPGTARTGGGSGADPAALIGGLGALLGVGWLIEKTADPYLAFLLLGAGVLVFAVLSWTARRFFQTKVGQFIAKALKAVFLAALAAVSLWLIHDAAGAEGLYWVGLMLVGAFVILLVVKAVRAFLETALGRLTMWAAAFAVLWYVFG